MKKESTMPCAAISMILVQVIVAGAQLLSRVILTKGTFTFAYITYRYIVATLCVAPFAFYFERRHEKKLDNWPVWWWSFLTSLVRLLNAIFFYYGLLDTSATYSTNLLSLVPIFTFIVSILFRMEKLELKTWAGKAKVVGTIICVGGALTTSLYTGKKFYIGNNSYHSSSTASTKQPKTHMLRGTLFLIASSFSYTGWFIIQVKLQKYIPLKYWNTMLTCFIVSIQGALIGLCMDSRKVSWSLGRNIELIAILYSGAFATALTFVLIAWVLSMKGPTYPSMFNPLALIFVAFSEAFFLGEPLKVGTLVGMVLIIGGLYCFLYGKRKETQNAGQPKEAAIELMTSMPSTSLQSIEVIASNRRMQETQNVAQANQPP